MWNISQHFCSRLNWLCYSCHWEMESNSAPLVICFVWPKECGRNDVLGLPRLVIRNLTASAWTFWYTRCWEWFLWNLATCCEKPEPHGETKCQLSGQQPQLGSQQSSRTNCQAPCPGLRAVSQDTILDVNSSSSAAPFDAISFRAQLPSPASPKFLTHKAWAK